MVANFSKSRDSLLSSTTSRISEYARYSAIINNGNSGCWVGNCLFRCGPERAKLI